MKIVEPPRQTPRFDQVARHPGPQDVLDEMSHVVQPAYADHGVCLKGPVLSGETPFERERDHLTLGRFAEVRNRRVLVDHVGDAPLEKIEIQRHCVISHDPPTPLGHMRAPDALASGAG